MYLLLESFHQQGDQKFPLLLDGPPTLLEVGMVDEILSDCDRVVEVEDCVPRPRRHEDCLSGVLDELNQPEVSGRVLLLNLGQDLDEEVYGFVSVVLGTELLAFDDVLGGCLWRR